MDDKNDLRKLEFENDDETRLKYSDFQHTLIQVNPTINKRH